MSEPLVSVILCSRDRPDMLRRALRSVLGQDTGNYEVVIVDDGSEPPVRLNEDLEHVRLIRIEHAGVGAARAAGLVAARGELIAYCDDDDEWKPSHLRRLREFLLAHPDIDLVYADSEWHNDGAPGTAAYSIDYEAVKLWQSNFIFATDAMHRAKPALDVGGFNPALTFYEDWDLWLRMSLNCNMHHLPEVLAIHHHHSKCLSVEPHWDQWAAVYEPHHKKLAEGSDQLRLGLDYSRTRIVPFDSASWNRDRKELIWHSVLRPSEGYGSVGWQLLLALEREGIDVTLAPRRVQPRRGFERFYKPLDHSGRIGFHYHYWVKPGVLPCELLVNYSMWESTEIPNADIEAINQRAALQLVPCQQNVESHLSCGLKVPIKVLHHAVDAEAFPFLKRELREVFTIGTFGDLGPRKGIDVLIRAFLDEFKKGEPVRLLIKGGFDSMKYQVDDSRVTVMSGYMTPHELLGMLQKMDVFVLPSRGEGFGLCGLEAMSTGLPLIATNWSGPTEYLDPADGFPLSYELVDARGIESNHVRYFGKWAEPSYEHLRQLLRWAFEHPNQLREMGRAASVRVQRDFTWGRIARQLTAYFNELVQERNA